MGQELQVLNVVTQGGSFAVLCCILWYVGMRLIPKEQQAREDLAATFTATLERLEEKHSRELAQRDATQARMADALTQVVHGLGDVTDRLERVEQRTDEHRPVRVQQPPPGRHPLPPPE